MSRRTAFPLGSEMWKKELSDHQKRLHTVRATLPAPSAPGSARPSTHSGRRQQATRRLQSPEGKTSAKGSGVEGSCPPASAAATKGLRIEELSPEDQRSCESMMSVLQKLSTADAKSILEELFVGCEMKRLLSQYTGVYPAEDAQAASCGSESAATAAQPTKRQSNEAHEPVASSTKAPQEETTEHQPASTTVVKNTNSTFNSSYASDSTDDHRNGLDGSSNAKPELADSSSKPRDPPSAGSGSQRQPEEASEEYGNESFEG